MLCLINPVIYEIVQQWACYILNSAQMNKIISETVTYWTLLYLEQC